MEVNRIFKAQGIPPLNSVQVPCFFVKKGTAMTQSPGKTAASHLSPNPRQSNRHASRVKVDTPNSFTLPCAKALLRYVCAR